MERQELDNLLADAREKTKLRRAKREEIRVLQAELRSIKREREQIKLRLSLQQNEVDEDILLARFHAREPEVVAQIEALETELKEEFERLTAAT